MLLFTAFLMAAPADDALEKALKAALPEGWTFVSGREASFAAPGERRCWLATLEVKKAGDYTLVVRTEHDPAHYYLRHTHSTCTYALGVGEAGTKRSVADGTALPQCNVGDRLVIPIPVTRGDRNHRFTLTAAPGGSRPHVFGHKHREKVTAAEEVAPPFKVDNKAAKHLKFISGTHLIRSVSMSRAAVTRGPWKHAHSAILEAAAPGKLLINVPIEIVKADAKVTGWVNQWRLVSGDEESPKHRNTGVYAGPPKWVLRVGDRIQVGFDGGPAKSRDEAATGLTISAGEFAEPKEPYRTTR